MSDDLAAIGLQPATFGQLSYLEREQEYPRSQEIAEAAYFLGYGGLIVPSARAECPNVIIFCDRASPGSLSVRRDHGIVEWEKRKPAGR